MNRRLIACYGTSLLAGLGVIGFEIIRDNPNENPYKLYPKVVEKADENKDGNVTETEWLNVYKFLNKPYDARKPSSLSIEDMRKYLDLN